MKRARASMAIGLLIFMRAAMAQDTGIIAGSIKDARTGEELNGANAMLEETGQGVVAKAEGRFRFSAVQPGSYTLIVSFVGYHTRFTTVSVETGEETDLSIELRQEPIPLHRILVEADRASMSTASSQRMRQFDLRIRPRQSTRDLLQIAPGLVTAGHAGGKAEQIFMRGFDSGFGTDVAVSVDGMPVNLVSHGHGQGYADLHFLIPEVVERMELFKGPYFAEYGNLANAAQIALYTRERLPQNSIRIEGGKFSSARYTALYQLPIEDDGNSAYFAGDYYHTDGPFDNPQDLHRLRLFAKVHHRLSPASTLSVDAGGVTAAWDASGLIPMRAVESGRITRWGAIDKWEGGSTSRQNANLTYRTQSDDGRREFIAQTFFSNYDFTLFSNYTFFLQDPIFGDMIEQTDERRITGLNSSYRCAHRVGPVPVTASLGGGFRADDIDLELWQDVRRRRYWPLVDAGVRERNFFLWGKEELIFGPRLRLVLGLRGDYFTFRVEDRLETSREGVLPLSEWVKKVLWEKHTGVRGKRLHIPLVQPHASGIAQQTILSPKANLVFSPYRNLDLFANIGTGFHSNDARTVIIGQFVREQWRAMEELGAEEDEIIVVLDTLNFDVELRNTKTLPRTVGGEIGLRMRLLSQGGISPAAMLGGPMIGHYPGSARFHAPVAELKGRLNLGAALWWIDVEEEFIYAAEVGTSEKRGRTRRRGLDLEARLQLLGWLWGDVDVNWAQGHLRDAPEDADSIPLAPRLTSTGGLTIRRSDRWEGSLRYRHIGDRPAVEDGSLTAEGYTLFDLGATCHTGRFRIDLTVENLFDAEWEEAQFAIYSLMPREPGPAIRGSGPPLDIHFMPGNPLNARLGVSFFY